MNRLAMTLAVIILPAWVLPASADGPFGLFGKKTKVNPAERVPELIYTLKTAPEERKRASAATELGTFDAATFAEIVPVLVDTLQNDPKYAVRMNAASSLGGLRPVSALAGQALERSAGSDSNARVRWHAKSILVKYRLAGYAPGSKGEPPLAGGPQTSEPPLLDAAVMSQPRKAPPGTSPPAPFPTGRVPANPASMPKTTAPPLSQEDALEFRPSTGRPSARGPTFSTAVPQRPTQTAPQPLPMVESEGPSLTPLAPVAPPPAPR